MSRTIFSGANVLDPGAPAGSRARERVTVVVKDNKISSVGGSVEPEPDDVFIDLDGRTLMPGLTTCHFHSTYRDVAGQVEPLGCEKPPVYLGLIAAEHLRGALHAGFTGVVSAGAIPADIDAQCKMAIGDGLIEGPRMLAGSRGLDTVAASTDLERWWWEIRNHGAQRLASGVDGFRDAVRDEVKRGAEIIKIFPTAGHAGYPGRPGTEGQMTLHADELRSVVDTAHQLGVKVRAHCVWKSAIRTCIESGVDVIDHGDQIDDELIELMVERGTYLVPSMFFVHVLLGEAAGMLGGTDSLEAARRDQGNMLEWLPRANAAGVKIVCGDDYGIITLPHGRYAEELAYYAKQVGIPSEDVLRWATVNGYELLGLGARAGRIEAGYLADLLVVDGDPALDLALLQDPERLQAVVLGGRFAVNRLGDAS